MLDVEAALALGQAELGLIPEAVAEEIAATCDAAQFDPTAVGEDARASGTPILPLVHRLRDKVGQQASELVHHGATSQDVLDTALVLMLRDAVPVVVAYLDRIADSCAELAAAHRDTPMAARTLLQQAVPTTFGAKAAGWLVAVRDATRNLDLALAGALRLQLGGAAGTLADFGDRGIEVMERVANRLELPAPTVPWHTARGGFARLAAALAVAAGAVAKVGLDIELLAQSEIAEVRDPNGGASSAMPHKRNPIGSAIARANASRVNAAAGVLLDAMVQEHERAAGAWHAEWESLRTAVALTGGACERIAEVTEGLQVDAARMRTNIDTALGPVDAIGSAGRFVDRALAEYHQRQH